ncbi:MAG: hypothetical protein EOP86_18570 [Verrucomicrobiaceae bacterium]|nr:MAG: hypothetical protein EOP86_18570 [Verrucomicrobiaceae bacterium]
MKSILLHPNDVMFFRDGRPMSGSLSGHGAAWPSPHVISHALHAALHRSGIQGVHNHRRGRSGVYGEVRDRKFGSLVTAGPFPVQVHEGKRSWFFPRPTDAGAAGSVEVTLRPVIPSGASNLPLPLRYPVGNTARPSKDEVPVWWSEGAWSEYLGTSRKDRTDVPPLFCADHDFAAHEHTYGIAIEPETGTAEEGRFYSASHLRLKEDWRLGILAAAPDKDYHNLAGSNDLIGALLSGQGGKILVGGQQRICSAVPDLDFSSQLPLPPGKTGEFYEHGGKFLLKWILLTPALFPLIEAGTSKRGTARNAHPGGWLPTWICPDTGRVLLETISPEERKRRRSLNAAGQGYASHPDIDARLAAAITGKPLPVTGWALPNGTDRHEGGAKSTHLAVPAGSVYYFECGSAEDAGKLAAALNWHGSGDRAAIRCRRSTLMGEKGFGLGVCGAWQFHPSA